MTVYKPERSWTSSINTWLTSSSVGSVCNLLSSTPVVTNCRRVSELVYPSRHKFVDDGWPFPPLTDLCVTAHGISDCLTYFFAPFSSNAVYRESCDSGKEKITENFPENTVPATLMAATLRGCVQMILQVAPRPRMISSSRINWGTCVVFPHPVSPLTIDTWLARTTSRTCCLNW